MKVNDIYYLCENDVIRFGNFKFILKEIHIKNKNLMIGKNKKLRYNINKINSEQKRFSLNFEPNLTEFIIDNKNYNTKDIEKECPFCHKEDSSEENPLVKLCSCDYKYMHYKCIKEDLRQKLIIKENKSQTSINYIFKFHCNNCKVQLPIKFKIDDIHKSFELIDIDLPKEEEYLLFQSLSFLYKNEYHQSIHLVKLIGDKNIIKIKIGRDGHNKDNDIKIDEESVSREQAIIEYNKENGSLILENISQKTDSLILIKDIIKINENKINLQIGNIFVETYLINEKVDKKRYDKIQDKKQYEEDSKNYEFSLDETSNYNYFN